MANLRPSNLVLRCYGHRIKGGQWYGICIDLNIAAQAETPDKLKKKLNGMILSYVDTVLDTDDKESIPELLNRSAPLYNWAVYYLFNLLISFRNFPNEFLSFKEFIPFRLSHNNWV